MKEFLVSFLQPLVVSFGILFALYQYWKQQKFKRLQNLSQLWKEFLNNDQNLELFNTMDEVERGIDSKIEILHKFDTKAKLKYLALIEEVALYVEQFEVDQSYAKYLFQWHFYYVYSSSKTSDLFWGNLGGDEEKNASYWSKSRNFAAKISL